jgi:hypothetical protein
VFANPIAMSRGFAGTRSIRLIAATMTASVAFTACQSDSPTASYAECAGQPGCQPVDAAVPVEVIQSLDDADSRITSVLIPSARASIEAQLAKLKVALVQRNLDAGRIAFAAAIDAIDRAERASRESAPDLGAIRLGLVPAARSLGLPVSSVDAPVL